MNAHDAILAGTASLTLWPAEAVNDNYLVAEVAIWRDGRHVYVTTFDEWGSEIRSHDHEAEPAARRTLAFFSKRFRPVRITTGLFSTPYDGRVA